MKLIYSDSDNTGVSAGGATYYQYRSSVYDPLYATGGHQPMYFDQYAAMYGRYRVLAMGFSLEATTDQQTNGPLFITCTWNTDGSLDNSLSEVRERKGTKCCTVSHGFKGRLRGYCSVAKAWGVRRQAVMYDDDYSALVTTNPAKQLFLNLQVWNQTTSNSISPHMNIRIFYVVKFYDPEHVAQS